MPTAAPRRPLGSGRSVSTPALRVARKLAEERGDAINVLPADAIAGWQKPAQIVIEDRVAELDKRGLKGKALLESARASLAEYDPPK